MPIIKPASNYPEEPKLPKFRAESIQPAQANTSVDPNLAMESTESYPSESEQTINGRLPRDSITHQPIPPRATPGYYPGFSTLDQQNFWDEVTRKLVLNRVNQLPPIRFFSDPADLTLITAIYDRIIPQDDRDNAHKIPLIPQLDARLFENRLNGYQYEDMPTDQEVYRLGLKAIEAIAIHLYAKAFVALSPLEQDTVLKTIHEGKPPAGEVYWQKMNVTRFWQTLVQDGIEGYYSHPYAWDEIGFGGPAYPRGYMRQNAGEPEPWEVQEKRYQWDTPPDSLSGEYTPIGGKDTKQSSVGQEGTH